MIKQFQMLSSSSASLSNNYYDRNNVSFQPLINEILRSTDTSFSNHSIVNSNTNTMNSSKSKSKHMDPKNVKTLVSFLIEAIQNFIKQSSDLANDYPELNNELTNEIDNIIDKGNKTFEASKQFTNDPLSSQKRKLMKDASRELLNSVGRLLV